MIFLKKNKSFYLLAGLIGAITLTACSSEEIEEESVNGSSTKIVTMTGWYDEENMRPVLEAVQKELDGNYELEYSVLDFQQYNNVLSTQLASGEGPDIVLDGSSFPARIKANNLMDISNENFIKEFNDTAFTLSKDDSDKIYGIPSYGWFSGIWINTDMFEENNLEIPVTFEEFLMVSESFSEKGINPVSMGLLDGDTGLHSMVGYLENSYYREEEDATNNDIAFSYGKTKLSDHLAPWVEKWMPIIEKGIINEEMLGISAEQSINQFINEEAAMFYGGPWNYNQFKDAGLNFKMIPHLGDTEEGYLIGGPAVNMGVNANTKNKEGALAVLEALASDSVQQAFLDGNPGSFSYKKDISSDTPAEYSEVEKSLEESRVSNAWDRWGVNMSADTLLGEVKKQIQNLILGETDVEEFLNSIDKKADEIRYK